MSLSIQSSTHAVTKTSLDFELASATKVAVQTSKAANPTAKARVSTAKPQPRLDESARIKQLAQQGHSNQQIAASIGLPEEVVALTLGDSTTSTTLATSTPSTPVVPSSSGRLSIYG